MAFSVTDRGDVSGGSVGSTTVIPSFTPGANRLLLCWVAVGGAGTVSGITGHGTWSQIALEAGWGGNSNNLYLWGCITGGSPSASAVTITTPGSYGAAAAGCFEIDGADVSSTVANAIVQSGSSNQYNSARSVTLSAFASSTNATVLVTATDAYGGGDNWTVEAGWEPIINEQSGEANLCGASAWRDGADTSATISGGGYFDTAVIAVEIAEATGGAHNLLADDVESAASVGSPTIGQVHAILADDIQSVSLVSNPALDTVAASPAPVNRMGTTFYKYFLGR